MQESQECNRNVHCPPVGAASTSVPPFESNDTLGSCTVGDVVICPLPASFIEVKTAHCHGNECCVGVDRTGAYVTYVCPSAGAGFTSCNLPKQIDCLGGMSGTRVQTVEHDFQMEPLRIRSEAPIDVPTIGPFEKIVNAEEGRDLATCNRHVCTDGWRLKLGLPENQPCETAPCTEVECCELFKSTTPQPETSPCAVKERVEEVPVPAPAPPAASKAVAGAVFGGIAVGGCILGCYLGRKWTQFQDWRRRQRVEKAEEEMLELLAEEEAAAAAAAAAAKKKKGQKDDEKGSGGGGSKRGSKETAKTGGSKGGSASAAAAAADKPAAAGKSEEI